MPAKTLSLPELFFDAHARAYWMRISPRRFLNLEKSDIKLHLRKAGLYAGTVDTGLNPVEKIITTAQTENYCDYAGPLAGHRVGRFDTSAGDRILVTSEPNPAVFAKPTSKSITCKFIEHYLGALFGPDQLLPVMLWFHFAVKSLRRGDFMPGQMLVLAGPPGCAKSFFHVLATELLGGRMGKPYLFMSGKSTFNADLAKCESLVLEDEQAATDIRSRLAFKAAIKQMTVNETFHVHPKGREAIALSTYKRLTLSVNWEAENLSILPPLDDDVLGKIMLLKCSDAKKCLSNDRLENIGNLRRDIPAFRAYLQTLKCPKSMADERFGVASYHNPELLEATNALAPETRLLNLIDEILFTKRGAEPFDGSAEELERQLRNSPFAPAVDKLLSFSSACGSYLGRLSTRTQRVEARKVKGKTKWIVRAP